MQDKIALRAVAEALRRSPRDPRDTAYILENGSALALIRALEEFIRRQPRIHLSLQDVAYVFGYAPTYCCKVFRRTTGKSFGQWNRHIRIEMAQELLLRSSASIERIAEAVGYGNVCRFERNFRKVAGMTPSAWRKRYRKHVHNPPPRPTRSNSTV